MAIENHQVETDQVITTAVCCTANLTLEAINDFLNQVWNEEEKTASSVYGPTHTLSLVHDLKANLWGVTKRLEGESEGEILRSPFAGLDYPQIREVLVQMKEATGSIVQTDWFLVLDEHSVETNSAVVVNVEPHGEHALRSSVQSLRADYPTAPGSLMAASIAHPPLGEMKEIMDDHPEKYGGILRDD